MRRRIVRRRHAIHTFHENLPIARNHRSERSSAIAHILERDRNRPLHELRIRGILLHIFQLACVDHKAQRTQLSARQKRHSNS
jgi:hypothetical protein